MPDNTNERGPADRMRVNPNEDYEVQYWSKKFGVSADELKQAAKAAGPMATDVEAYLKKGKAA